MGFLSLFTKFFKKESPDETNYLSVAITPREFLALIWYFEVEKLEVLGFGQKKFENIDNLIHEAAIAIDKAGEQAQSDVEKAVFGLSHFWLEDGKPKAETAKILKELAEALELKPQAFIPLASAINHLLKVEESQTPHAILVGLFSDFCEVHLLESNQVVTSLTSKSPVNLEKVTQLISQLKAQDKNLPARIILYGSGEQAIEEIKNQEFPDLFVHQPKVEVLENQQLAKSVAYAQAADILGHEPILKAVSQESPDTLLPSKKSHQINEFGFIEGADILLEKAPEKKEEEQPSNLEKEYAIDVEEQNNLKPQKESRKMPEISLLPKILGLVKFRSSGKKLFIGAAIFLLFLLSVTFVLGQTFVKSEVQIKVNAQNIEDSFKVEVIAGDNPEENSQIQGQEISQSANGSQKAVATGSKKLGDKAKGTLKLLNWDKQPKTFAEGAEVITKDGLKFTLDGEAQTASRSATSPGEAKVGATSIDFGPKYNVAAGVDLTIVGFDEIFYSAITDTAFTGGAERQSTVVSADDLEKLEKSLTATISEKAKNVLKEKTSGKNLHDEAITLKISKKQFDKKQDDEASLVNLDMELDATSIVYEELQLKDFLAKNAKDVPPNLQARVEDIEILTISAKAGSKKNSLILSGKFRVALVPKLADDEIKEKIAGKSPKEAREILKTVAEVSDVKVVFTPNLPLLESIPKNKSRIKLKIEAN